jgi:hypothetical protein
MTRAREVGRSDEPQLVIAARTRSCGSCNAALSRPPESTSASPGLLLWSCRESNPLLYQGNAIRGADSLRFVPVQSRSLPAVSFSGLDGVKRAFPILTLRLIRCSQFRGMGVRGLVSLPVRLVSKFETLRCWLDQRVPLCDLKKTSAEDPRLFGQSDYLVAKFDLDGTDDPELLDSRLRHARSLVIPVCDCECAGH